MDLMTERKHFDEPQSTGNIVEVGSESVSEIPAAAVPDVWKAGKQQWLIILCLCVLSLVVALDATILVPALPTIASALDAPALSTYWMGTSYLLSNAVVQPVISALSDIFGRRSLLFTSAIFFTVGSVIACLAHGVAQILAGRVVQGVGGGGIIVLTNVIISDIVPLRQRPKYLSITQLSWAVGTVAGPLVGGALAQSTTWRWIFYLNFPFCGIGLAMVPLVVQERRCERNMLHSIASVDWIGISLFVSGFSAFLIAVSWGGVQYPWNSYQTLVPLLVGLFVIALSLVWEASVANQPFIKLSIYKSLSAAGAITCTLLQGFLLYLGLYYISFYFLSVRHFTPVKTGLAFLPLNLALTPTAAATGVFISRTGRFHKLIWLGWCIITLANGLLILLGMSTPTVAWVFMFIVAGVGQGIIVTTLNITIQASVESKYAGDASALYAFMRSLGMALGVGIGGAVFQNRLAHQLSVAGLPESISTSAEEFVLYLDALPASQHAYVSGVLEAFARAFHNLFEISTAVAGLALLVSLVVGHSNLDRVLETRHGLQGKCEDRGVFDEEAREK